MNKNIRLISFLCLFFLAFAPLGSCANKRTVNADGGVSISSVSLDKLSAEELKSAQISSIRIFKFQSELDRGEENGGVAYLVFLVISFLGSRVTKMRVLARSIGALATLFVFMVYGFFSVAAIVSPTTTLFCWLFMLFGVVYFYTSLNSYFYGVVQIT